MITFRRFSTPSETAAWSPAKGVAWRLSHYEDRQSWLVWENDRDQPSDSK